MASLLFVPRSTHLQRRVPFDWPGFGLFFPAVAALVFALSRGPPGVDLAGRGWCSPPWGSACVRRTRTTVPDPMVDLSLFRRRYFAVGVSTSLLAFLVLFGVLVVVPFYLERALGLGPVRTGLELMVMPLALGLVAPWSGRLADVVGVSPAVTGLGMAGSGLLAALQPATAGFLALLALVGAGLGLFISPNNAGIMAAVPARQSGLASGLLNMSRGLGTALGLAVTTAVFSALGGDGGQPAAVDQPSRSPSPCWPVSPCGRAIAALGSVRSRCGHGEPTRWRCGPGLTGSGPTPRSSEPSPAWPNGPLAPCASDGRQG